MSLEEFIWNDSSPEVVAYDFHISKVNSMPIINTTHPKEMGRKTFQPRDIN